MPTDKMRESSAREVLRELLELLDRHPHLLQYVRTAGLVESRLPKLIALARELARPELEVKR